MKRRLKVLGVVVGMVLCGVVFGFTKDAMAKCTAQVCDKMDLIDRVTSIYPSVACGDHNNYYNTTLFNVGYSWGKECDDGQCQMTGSWHCISRGEACPSSWAIEGWGVNQTDSDDNYDYYSVTVWTASGYQNAQNTFKRKKEKVKVRSFAKCTDGTALNNGEKMDSIKIDKKIGSGKIGRSTVDELNNLLPADSQIRVKAFDSWEGYPDCGTSTKCKVSELKKDTDVNAIYQCAPKTDDCDGPCCPDEDCPDDNNDHDPGGGGGPSNPIPSAGDGQILVNFVDVDTNEYLGSYSYSASGATAETPVDVTISAGPCWLNGVYEFVGGDSPVDYCGATPTVTSTGGGITYTNYYKRYFKLTVHVVDSYNGNNIDNYSVDYPRYVYVEAVARTTGDYYIWDWDSPCQGWTGYTCGMGQIDSDMEVTVYVRRKLDLIGIAYDDYDREEIKINGRLCQDGDYSIWQGFSASVSRMSFGCDLNTLYSGYTWRFWDSEQRLCGYETGYNCWTPELIEHELVYAHFEKNVFNARIIASGSTNAKVATSGDGYTRIGGTAVGYAENCTNGCPIQFDSSLKRVSGSGDTPYHVKRTSSNLTTTARGIQNKDFGQGRGGNTTTGQLVKTDNVVLYPGMYVCEEMTFDSAYNENNRLLKLCIYAHGNAQPDDPANVDTPEDDPGSGKLNGDNAFINIKVRNQDVARWAKYQRAVYGKPGDTLAYRSSYNPVLQYSYHVQLTSGVLERVLIDGGNEVTGLGQKVGTLFNQKVNPGWNNAFSIFKRDVRAESLISNNKYPAGLFDKQSPAANTVRVLPEDAGSQITETAITNRENAVKTTPSQVTFASNYGNVITAQKQRTAIATIPYNFIINTNITSPDPEEKQSDGSPKKTFFAGEEGSINYRVSVDNKTNQYTTDGSTGQAYATNAKQTRNKIIIYYPSKVPKKGGGTMNGGIGSNVCSVYYGYGGTDDSYCSEIDGGITNLTPGAHDSMKKFFVEDLPAGSEICIASAAFPATSGADTNWNDLNYDGRWRVSESKCYRIAKRPNMQVWGGNVYSAGKMSATRAVKRNLYGYTAFSTLNPQGYFVFGSWGEHGVISRGEVSGFASGATLGYGSNDNGSLLPNPYIDNNINKPANPGGSSENNFCKHSVLTFANQNCLSGTTGGTGGKDSTEGVALDVNSIESLIGNAGKIQDVSGPLTVGEEIAVGGEDDGILLYRNGGTLEVRGGHTARNTFKIVSAVNIDLTDNISLVYGESFATFKQIPKVVLYASDTIYIGCNVTHVEALLVANRVVTCKNIDSDTTGGMAGQLSRRINDKQNSQQLYINGAVIAGRLYANRTYGAGNGANSVVPAEIIDFDPTLYMWGGIAGGAEGQESGNGNMEVTYIKELAPRF